MQEVCSVPSLQLRILRFGFLQDGDVGVSVFPQREEILIRCAGFGGVALHSVSAGEAEMSKRCEGKVHDDAWMVEKFLELSRGLRTLILGTEGIRLSIRSCC